MRRLLPIALLLLAAAPTFALPGLDISVGPFAGIYAPSLKTLNDEELAWEHRPKLSSSPIFGGELKFGLPMGLGFGIDAGVSTKKDTWSDTPNLNETWTYNYKIRLIPLDLFATYSIPVVPLLLKAKVGVTAGMTWARMEQVADHINNGTTNHYYENSTGSGTAFGLLAGLDLVTIPRITIGLDAGYRAGKVSDLKIKESSNPARVNTLRLYEVHATGQDLPLPLELSGLSARLVARFHF